MGGSYVAELVRTARRPAVWVLLTAWLVLYHLFSYAFPYLGYRTGAENPETQGVPPAEVLGSTLPDQVVVNALSGLPMFAGAIALVFGVVLVGSEYAWGTMATLLTQGPSRTGVLAAKLAVALTGTLVAMVVTFGTGAAVSALIAGVEGKAADWPGLGDLAVGFASGWLIVSMWTLAGMCGAVAFRGVALPVGLGVIWVLAVENVLSAVADGLVTGLQPLRDVLPGVNAGSLVTALIAGVDRGAANPGLADSVGGGQALATLVGYLLLFALGSAVVLRRRDVT